MEIFLLLVFITLFVVGWAASRYSTPSKPIVHDRIPNKTNYNINMIGPEQIEKMSQEEAKELIDKLEKSDLPSLAHRDFYALKKKAGEG